MRELKDLLIELRETNKLLRNTLEETQKEKAVLQQERDNFKEQVDYLTKKLFGSSSEKNACDIPGQMNIFNEAKSEMYPAVEASDMRTATKPPESELAENKVKKRRSLLRCMSIFTGNCWRETLQWQTKLLFRYCMSRNAIRSQSHIFGCFAAAKTESIRASSTSIPKHVHVIRQ